MRKPLSLALVELGAYVSAGVRPDDDKLDELFEAVFDGFEQVPPDPALLADALALAFGSGDFCRPYHSTISRLAAELPVPVQVQIGTALVSSSAFADVIAAALRWGWAGNVGRGALSALKEKAAHTVDGIDAVCDALFMTNSEADFIPEMLDVVGVLANGLSKAAPYVTLVQNLVSAATHKQWLLRSNLDIVTLLSTLMLDGSVPESWLDHLEQLVDTDARPSTAELFEVVLGVDEDDDPIDT